MNVIKELNKFLEGNYMAVHAYEKYIYHCENPELKHTFQQIQQEHKQHAQLIAERIQNLGGISVDNPGVKGTIVEWFKKLTDETNGDLHIVKDALAGETRGIEVSQQILNGDLDPKSRQLVERILSHDKIHVERLRILLQQMN